MAVRTYVTSDVNDIGRLFVVDNVFQVTLINVSSASNGLADFTSTLEVLVDEVENGTTIIIMSLILSDKISISD